MNGSLPEGSYGRRLVWTSGNTSETPYKEELDFLRHSIDLRCEGSVVRQAYNSGKSGDWHHFFAMLCLPSSSCSASLQHSVLFTLVDALSLPLPKNVSQTCTDFLRRIIVPVVGQGGVWCLFVVCVLSLPAIPA